MSYRVYHSDAVVLSSRIAGESDREYRLMTREHGIVRARARAVRLGRSKLRYVLHPYCAIRVDMVRGKVGWRITGAVLIDQFPGIRGEKGKRTAVSRGFRLIARLLHREEPVPGVYRDLRDLLEVVDAGRAEDSRAYELAFAARVLGHLGYWKPEEGDRGMFSGALKDVPLAGVVGARSRLVASINDALRQTHL